MDKKSDLRKKFNFGEGNGNEDPEIKIYSRGASRND